MEDSCGTDTYCNEVVYCQNLPHVDFGYEVDETLVMFHDSSLNASSWWWSFGDGYFSDLQNPVHIFDDFGVYEVCLTAANVCLEETFCSTISLDPVGIDESMKGLSNVYPNPAHDHLCIQSPVLGRIEYTITTSDGRYCCGGITELASGQTGEISLVGLSPGLYVLRLFSPNHSEIVKLVVLEELTADPDMSSLCYRLLTADCRLDLTDAAR